MSRMPRYAIASIRFLASSLCRPSASTSTAPCQSNPARAGAAPSSSRASVKRSRLMRGSMSRARRWRRCVAAGPGVGRSCLALELLDRPLHLVAQAGRQLELEHVLVLLQRFLLVADLPVQHGEVAARDP